MNELGPPKAIRGRLAVSSRVGRCVWDVLKSWTLGEGHGHLQPTACKPCHCLPCSRPTLPARPAIASHAWPCVSTGDTLVRAKMLEAFGVAYERAVGRLAWPWLFSFPPLV